eukprot:gene16723-18417_t
MAEEHDGTVSKDLPANHNQGNDSEKSFQERLNDIPMYTMSLNQLYSMYSSLKDRNDVLKKAFDAGEYYAQAIATTAKPVLINATNTALAAAKPVIGDVQDPGAALDSIASKTLAEVEKKFPVITKTPCEIAESTKEAIKTKAASCIGKIQESAPAQIATKQVENAISLSELMVEICFPTDGACAEDVAELEREESDEHKDAVTRIGNLKDKIKHRGTRKLMQMKPILIGVDAVHYAQERVEEMNRKLGQGTNYLKDKANEAKTFAVEKKMETEDYVHKTNEMLKEEANKVWDKVYTTTMYIPSKAMKISGEVLISTKEIVFAYTQAHSVTELPHAIVDMVDKYYASLKETQPQVTDAADKAVAFVVVPAQVVAEYLLASRPVQWIIPSVINAEEVKIMEELEMSELEGEVKK